MDPGSASQGVQGCPSPGMAERGEGNGGCNRGDGLPPVPGTAPAAVAATATTSKCVTECTGMCEHDKPGCKWSRLSGAGMSTRKHARNARTGTSMVWCAMDSPTANVYAAECASACTEFWLCEYAWWTKVW